MSPLMWFSLFIMFSIVLILFNQLNLFTFKMDPNKKTKMSSIFKKDNQNWKW